MPDTVILAKTFFRKYFLEGQKLASDPDSEIVIAKVEADSFEERFIKKHRKFIGFVAPIIFWHLLWWTAAVKHDLFALFPVRYEMCLTMVFGAMVAGMTSEGGGAVAFPVMTLLLKIPPEVARDFSLMIQSFGMTSAAFTITWMQIVLEWRSIIFCSLGGMAGVIFGLEFIDPHMTPAQKKMAFVSIWFSFAMALFQLNMQKKRKTYLKIYAFNWWKVLVLVAIGFVGGIFTSFAGSGVDICSFSVLTLFFHVSEKVATPTSVVLMAVNSCVGFYWRQVIMGSVSKLAWEYLAVCVPIVVICAPLGSLIGSHFHRLVLASLIYLLEIVALICAFAIVRPGLLLSLSSIGIIFGGFCFFVVLSKIGTRLSNNYVSAQKISVENGTVPVVAMQEAKVQQKTEQ